VSKLWRTLAISAAASAAVATGAVPALAQPTAGPSVTISLTSAVPKAYGYTFVAFHDSYKDGKYSKVTVAGSVSGATAGMVAQLYAQTFPYKTAAAPVTGQQLVLDGTSPEAYRFTATPGLATRYQVEVLPSTTVSSPIQATSATDTAYVATTQPATANPSCNKRGNRPVCHETFKIYTILPASAYRAESRKKLYFYFAVNLNRRRIPPAPTQLTLEKSAKISKARRISSIEFEQTVTFSFRVYDDGYNFNFSYCSKASESSDGVNLPGHHHCGAKKIKATWFLG
jgi:hypothetical protein